jgi:hypothetical protein
MELEYVFKLIKKIFQGSAAAAAPRHRPSPAQPRARKVRYEIKKITKAQEK